MFGTHAFGAPYFAQAFSFEGEIVIPDPREDGTVIYVGAVGREIAVYAVGREIVVPPMHREIGVDAP